MINAKILFKRFLGLFPSKLPQGVTEFDAWLNDIATTYSLPTQSIDDITFVLATTIFRLGPTAASKSKYYFVLTLRAAASKQIAAHALQNVKQKQAEATALAGSSDAPKQP